MAGGFDQISDGGSWAGGPYQITGYGRAAEEPTRPPVPQNRANPPSSGPSWAPKPDSPRNRSTQVRTMAEGRLVSDLVQPSHSYITLRPNKRFVGRTGILKTIENKLFTSNECQKLALVGLGGVGKTQVALQFASWVKENKPEYSIFWVPTLSAETFEKAYTEIAGLLGLRINADDKDLKEPVRQHLSSDQSGPWLMIVDNADDMDVLFGSSDVSGGMYEYLPDGNTGLVLFTTRWRKVAVAVAGSNIIDLGE